MSDIAVLTVEEPGEPPRSIRLSPGRLEIGRECEGVILHDPAISRRHLVFTYDVSGLTVSDLNSVNGTTVNGAEVQTALIHPGDVVSLGGTRITYTELIPEPATLPAEPASQTPGTPFTGAPQSKPAEAPPLRPALEKLARRDFDAATFLFLAGTRGEAAAGQLAPAFRRARKRLAGFGSEATGVKPLVCMVDPFPDPDKPEEMVTEGTILDPSRGEIWIVVSPHMDEDPPERVLALFFGCDLPACNELYFMIEGLGLHLAGHPDPNPDLLGVTIPPLREAKGEIAPLASLSFVNFLVRKNGVDAVKRFLVEARPENLDSSAEHFFGKSLTGLEEQWRADLTAEARAVRPLDALRLIVPFLKPHRLRGLEMFVFLLFSAAFTGVYPFALRQLVDVAIPRRDAGGATRVLLLLTAAFLITVTTQLRVTYLSAYVGASIVRDLRQGMFEKLQVQSAGWFHRHEEGDVVARFYTDVVVLEQTLAEVFDHGVSEFLALLVACVVVLKLNPILGAVVIGSGPLVAIVFRLMGKGAQVRSMEVQDQTGGLMAMSSDNYGASNVVRAYGLEGREQSRFGAAAQRLFKSQIRMHLFTGIFGLSVGVIISVIRLIVIGLGVWLIFQGRFTLGGLIAFIGVMIDVLRPITALTTIGQGLQESTGSVIRIRELLDAEPEISDQPGAGPAAPLVDEIRLEGVRFGYSPEQLILDGVDAVIPASSKVAFVGPTGAGKSSVLRLLTRFYEPDEGKVTIDGQDMRTLTLASLREQMGVVFQDTILFNTTIRENIASGKPGATEQEILEAAKAAEIDDFVVSLPRGYDTLVGEGGGRLSGGQRQRLALARALIRKPSILLLDEATSALDPHTERTIARTLDKVAEGITTVSVTHRLGLITGYDLIYVISDGKVAEKGTHEELLAREGIYWNLWVEQSGKEAPGAAAPAPMPVPAGGTRLSRVTSGPRSGLHSVAAPNPFLS